MPPTSRFTLDQRRDAVARAFEDGPDDPTSVARELGVHPATLYRWATDIAMARPAEPRSRERLIRAAEALLRRLDYGDITVELIAEEAGVALRTAFHNYPSKQDLFHAVVDDAARALVDEMERRAQAMEWPAEPIAQLRTFLRVGAEAAYARPDAHVLFRDLGVPASDGYAEQWHQRFELAVARLASDAAKAGQLESDIDPAEAARVISRMMRGLHAAVFEGADAAQAIRIADRLHRTIAS
jgi:AcrR family transcriptional regulator